MAHSKAADSTPANSRTSIRLLKAPEVKRVIDCMLMCGPKAPNIFAYQKAEQLNMPKTSFVRYVWDGGGIRSAVASFFGLRAVSVFSSPIVTCMLFCPPARMQERFNKTGKLEAPRGRPARVTAEQMYAIKEQVEEGVGDTETLSKRAFVQLANDAALLNARLEGRGINFTELAVNTVKRLIKEYQIIFVNGKVRPGSRAESEACQRSAYSLAAVVAALFEIYPAIPQLLANTDETTLALTDEVVEVMVATKASKTKMDQKHKSVAKSQPKTAHGNFVRIHGFFTTTAAGRSLVPCFVLQGHGIEALEIIKVFWPCVFASLAVHLTIFTRGG